MYSFPFSGHADTAKISLNRLFQACSIPSTLKYFRCCILPYKPIPVYPSALLTFQISPDWNLHALNWTKFNIIWNINRRYSSCFVVIWFYLNNNKPLLHRCTLQLRRTFNAECCTNKYTKIAWRHVLKQNIHVNVYKYLNTYDRKQYILSKKKSVIAACLQTGHINFSSLQNADMKAYISSITNYVNISLGILCSVDKDAVQSLLFYTTKIQTNQLLS